MMMAAPDLAHLWLCRHHRCCLCQVIIDARDQMEAEAAGACGGGDGDDGWADERGSGRGSRRWRSGGGDGGSMASSSGVSPYLNHRPGSGARSRPTFDPRPFPDHYTPASEASYGRDGATPRGERASPHGHLLHGGTPSRYDGSPSAPRASPSNSNGYGYSGGAMARSPSGGCGHHDYAHSVDRSPSGGMSRTTHSARSSSAGSRAAAAVERAQAAREAARTAHRTPPSREWLEQHEARAEAEAARRAAALQVKLAWS